MNAEDTGYHEEPKKQFIPRDMFHQPALQTSKDLPSIALISAAIASIFSLSVFSLTFELTNFTKLPIYVIFLSVFHFLEFLITALFNPSVASSDSFLLNNGAGYNIAHLVAFFEALLEYKYSTSFFPYHIVSIISTLGFILVLIGQLVRSLAMINASTNFSHTISRKKQDSHKLVTTGIYAYSRHPSYCGFFYWALGLQLFMFNPLSFIGFTIVLWKFFDQRITDEESYLVTFFGDQYLKYRTTTPTRIPFIP